MQKISYCLFWPLYKVFARLKITGRENLIGLRGPVILASNHTSELDVTALPMVLPFFSSLSPIYFISNATKKYRENKKFGWRRHIYGGLFFKVLGGISSNSGIKDYATALKNHVELLTKGHTLCIFPEGKCTLDGNIGLARGGLGYLVHTTRATVVPIAINTFFKFSFKDFLFRKRKISITVGKPLQAEDIVLRGVTNPDVEEYRFMANTVLNKIKEIMNQKL